MIKRAIALCRSPSLTSDYFISFISNLKKLFINVASRDPHFMKLLGDFKETLKAFDEFKNKQNSV